MKQTLPQLLAAPNVIAKFMAFNPNYEETRNIITTIAASPELRKCAPQSIVGAALSAVQLHLPLTKQQGCAFILPYGQQAQFQLGYKGWIQLALRSHLFEKINAVAIYEGQLKNANVLTEEFEFDWTIKPTGEPIGYIGYFKLKDGFSKTLFVTREEMAAHAKRYSRTYATGGGVWGSNFDEMAKKTVLSKILRTYAPQTPELTSAYAQDQTVATINEETGEIATSYDDNPQTIIVADGDALGDEEGGEQ